MGFGRTPSRSLTQAQREGCLLCRRRRRRPSECATPCCQTLRSISCCLSSITTWPPRFASRAARAGARCTAPTTRASPGALRRVLARTSHQQAGHGAFDPLDPRARRRRRQDLPRMRRARPGLPHDRRGAEPRRRPLSSRRQLVGEHPLPVGRRDHSIDSSEPGLPRRHGVEQEGLRPSSTASRAALRLSVPASRPTDPATTTNAIGLSCRALTSRSFRRRRSIGRRSCKRPVAATRERGASGPAADCTPRLLYLEQTYPRPPLLPADPALRAECLLLEDWSDAVLLPLTRRLAYWHTLSVPGTIERLFFPGSRGLRRWIEGRLG